MSALTTRRCTPCQGGIPPLEAAAARELLAQIPSWELRENATWLGREFKFRNYAEAFALVTGISALAEEEGHHPDICFGWGYCSVVLYTHKIDGLHANDFILAAKIDRLVGAGP